MSKGRNGKAHHQAEQDGRIQYAPQRGIVPRAVFLRDQDRRATVEARKEPDHQIDDRRSAPANRGQRVIADILSHNKGVRRVIQLLKQQLRAMLMA